MTESERLVSDTRSVFKDALDEIESARKMGIQILTDQSEKAIRRALRIADRLDHLMKTDEAFLLCARRVGLTVREIDNASNTEDGVLSPSGADGYGV